MRRTATGLAQAAAVLAVAFCTGCAKVVPQLGGTSTPAVPQTAPGLPKEVQSPADGSTLLLVPAGEFLMGQPEQPKKVVLNAFYIDKLEVSNEQYGAFLDAVAKEGDARWRHPDQPATKRSHVPLFWDSPELGRARKGYPVVGIDWFDACAYAKWAGKRLPTEAEWERAARGTDGRAYPWGEGPPEEHGVFRANFFPTFYAADGYEYTAPCGSFANGASPAGALNMAGNVTEWCADWFAALPSERRLANPVGPAAGTQRVAKGGAWNLAAASLRCYSRWAMGPSERLSSVGLRCARDAATVSPEPPAEPPAN